MVATLVPGRRLVQGERDYCREKSDVPESFSAIASAPGRQATRDEAALHSPWGHLPAHPTLLRAAVLSATRSDGGAGLRVSPRTAGDAVRSPDSCLCGDVESLPPGRD